MLEHVELEKKKKKTPKQDAVLLGGLAWRQMDGRHGTSQRESGGRESDAGCRASSASEPGLFP